MGLEKVVPNLNGSVYLRDMVIQPYKYWGTFDQKTQLYTSWTSTVNHGEFDLAIYSPILPEML